jgi:hypothetical protein
MQQILKKRREFNLKIYSFVYYGKAYDNLNRENLWQILREEDVTTQLLKSIQSLYHNSKTRIKYNDGQISEHNASYRRQPRS